MKKNSVKVTILSLSLLTVMAGASISPALGAIQEHFSSANSTLIKLVITTPALFIIITSFFFGHVAKRLKSRALTILGLILYTVGGTLGGIANSIYVLLLCRIVLGIGVGFLMPLSTGLIGLLFDKEEQGKILGYSAAMNNLGGVISATVSGILVAISWRYSFLIYLLGVIISILVLIFLPNRELHSNNSKIDKATIKKIVPFIITMFLNQVIFYAFPSNFAIVATKSGVIPVASIGLVMSIMNLVAFFMGLVFSQLVGIFKNSLKLISAIVLAAGFAAMGVGSSLLLIIAGLFGVGFGMGLIVPIINSQTIATVGREKSASAMVVMSASIFLGQFLSPIVLDSISSLLNIESVGAPYLVAACFSLLLFVILIFVPTKYGEK